MDTKKKKMKIGAKAKMDWFNEACKIEYRMKNVDMCLNYAQPVLLDLPNPF